jgi:hypothetical protein
VLASSHRLADPQRWLALAYRQKAAARRQAGAQLGQSLR